MAQFIFTNIFMLALGTILYLFVRALPRVEEEEVLKQGFLERWITSDLPEKFDFAVSGFLVKFLRRLKVFVLRIDNVVGDRLKKMNLTEKQNGAKPDWSEITGNNNGSTEVAKNEEISNNIDEN
jgi:hypothetical protein